EEAARPGGQRPAQVAGTAETGEDEDAAGGGRRAQCGGGLQPGEAGHLHVQDGDVRAVVGDGGHDLVAAPHLGDHRQVVLQGEQRGDGAPDQALVVGEDDSDHAAASFAPTAPGSCPEAPPGTGSTARSRKPPSPVPVAESVPPTAATRSDRPVSPLPNTVSRPARTPSLHISTTQARSRSVRVMSQCRAALCRSTFVAPSRTSHATSDCDRSGSASAVPVTVVWTP